MADPSNPWGLTPGQQNIVRLMAEGRTYKQIGLELGVTASTIRGHASAVMEKAGVSGGAPLVAKWYAERVLPAEKRSAYRQGYIAGHKAAQGQTEAAA